MTVLRQLQAVIGAGVLAVVVLVYVRRVWGRKRMTSASTGNALEVVDESFSPARYNAALALRSQHDHGPVTPTPDDWSPGPFGGRIPIKPPDAHAERRDP